MITTVLLTVLLKINYASPSSSSGESPSSGGVLSTIVAGVTIFSRVYVCVGGGGTR